LNMMPCFVLGSDQYLEGTCCLPFSTPILKCEDEYWRMWLEKYLYPKEGCGRIRGNFEKCLSVYSPKYFQFPIGRYTANLTDPIRLYTNILTDPIRLYTKTLRDPISLYTQTLTDPIRLYTKTLTDPITLYTQTLRYSIRLYTQI
jgi:hypothetical protein